MAITDTIYASTPYSKKNMLLSWIRNLFKKKKNFHRWSVREIAEAKHCLETKSRDESMLAVEWLMQRYLPAEEQRTEAAQQKILGSIRSRAQNWIKNPPEDPPAWDVFNQHIEAIHQASQIEDRHKKLLALRDLGVISMRAIIGRKACEQCQKMENKKLWTQELIAAAESGQHWCSDVYLHAILPPGPYDDPKFATWLEKNLHKLE